MIEVTINYIFCGFTENNFFLLIFVLISFTFQLFRSKKIKHFSPRILSHITLNTYAIAELTRKVWAAQFYDAQTFCAISE